MPYISPDSNSKAHNWVCNNKKQKLNCLESTSKHITKSTKQESNKPAIKTLIYNLKAKLKWKGLSIFLKVLMGSMDSNWQSVSQSQRHTGNNSVAKGPQSTTWHHQLQWVTGPQWLCGQKVHQVGRPTVVPSHIVPCRWAGTSWRLPSVWQQPVSLGHGSPCKTGHGGDMSLWVYVVSSTSQRH